MKKVFVIAEAGVNHNGDVELAKKLVDFAVVAGADAVKFQTFKAESLACLSVSKAEYQKENSGVNETQFEMLKKLELSRSAHIELVDYCKQKGIMFLSSPFDSESVDFLNDLGVEIFKIPSGEITNLPYLKKIASLNKEVILSTGMSTMQEVKEAVVVLKDVPKLTLLHCNTQYPTDFEDVNLLAMKDIQTQIGFEVGYSDHTEGIEVAVAAVALGASVIEKHFTLDKNLEGPDHKASLNPDELKAMVKAIRNIEKALGDGVKTPSNSEFQNINIVRKFIVAAEDINEGDIFTEKNLAAKRSGGGLSPMIWEEILGRKATRKYQKDEIISV